MDISMSIIITAIINVKPDDGDIIFIPPALIYLNTIIHKIKRYGHKKRASACIITDISSSYGFSSRFAASGADMKKGPAFSADPVDIR